MANKRYIWRVFNPNTQEYESTISETEPTVAPSDGITPVDPAFTTIMESLYLDFISDGYVNLESKLSDNQAVKIIASNVNGGIDIDAGIGGITIDSTNAISLDASAASNFTTSIGNLTLDATAGLVNIDAGSGINLGNASTTTPINIGTSSNSKNITMGNNTGTTSIAIRSGSGKIIINSAATGSDAIQTFSSGGIDIDATGDINLATGSSSGSAIVLDAAFNNGGIVISSGSQGIAISSNGGLIGIGHWSGGEVQIGTAAVSRLITMGNSTGTTSITLNSGTGGISIGNNANSGEIQIGNVANAKTITIGNSTGASRLFKRYGTGGLITHQEAHTALSDADATLAIADILKNIISITPTANRTLTLPTAANAVAGISGVQIGDSIEFTIINGSTAAIQASIILANNTGSSIIGNVNVNSLSNALGTYFTSGSGIFRLRFTNVTSGSEAYTVYRIS